MKNSKIKNYLEWLQNLPDNQKKIVLWTIVGVLGIIMGIFWIKGAMYNLSKIGESVSQVKLPEIQAPVINIPDTASPATPSSGILNK